MPSVLCKVCNEEFYAKPNWLKLGWGKYCSKTCQFEGQKKGHTIKCFICEKEAYKSPKELRSSKSGNFFCSKSCQTLWRNRMYVGRLHPSWVSGISTYRHLLLNSKKKQVCSLCGTTDNRVLAVHHLDKNRSNNDLINLIWLCHNCHYLIHHYDIEEQKLADKL